MCYETVVEELWLCATVFADWALRPVLGSLTILLYEVGFIVVKETSYLQYKAPLTLRTAGNDQTQRASFLFDVQLRYDVWWFHKAELKRLIQYFPPFAGDWAVIVCILDLLKEPSSFVSLWHPARCMSATVIMRTVQVLDLRAKYSRRFVWRNGIGTKDPFLQDWSNDQLGRSLHIGTLPNLHWRVRTRFWNYTRATKISCRMLKLPEIPHIE